MFVLDRRCQIKVGLHPPNHARGCSVLKHVDGQASHQKMLVDAQGAVERRLEEQEEEHERQLKAVRREYEEERIPQLESQALIASRPDPELEAAKQRVAALEDDLRARESALVEQVCLCLPACRRICAFVDTLENSFLPRPNHGACPWLAACGCRRCWC